MKKIVKKLIGLMAFIIIVPLTFGGLIADWGCGKDRQWIEFYKSLLK
jgi:hypothetical protein